MCALLFGKGFYFLFEERLIELTFLTFHFGPTTVSADFTDVCTDVKRTTERTERIVEGNHPRPMNRSDFPVPSQRQMRFFHRLKMPTV